MISSHNLFPISFFAIATIPKRKLRHLLHRYLASLSNLNELDNKFSNRYPYTKGVIRWKGRFVQRIRKLWLITSLSKSNAYFVLMQCTSPSRLIDSNLFITSWILLISLAFLLNNKQIYYFSISKGCLMSRY